MALTSSWGIFCAKEQVVVCIATSNTGRKRDHVQEAEVRKLGTSKREDLRGRNLLSLHYTWCHEQRRRRLWREMCCRRKDFKREDFHKVDKLCFSALGTYWYIGWFIFTEDKRDHRYWNLEQKTEELQWVEKHLWWQKMQGDILSQNPTLGLIRGLNLKHRCTLFASTDAGGPAEFFHLPVFWFIIAVGDRGLGTWTWSL